MKLVKIALLFFIISQNIIAQKNNKMSQKFYPKALVNYKSFKSLVLEIEDHRAKRLVSLNEFLKLDKEDNTIILDTRSAYFYKKRHIKGAVNLPFTEFTQESLTKLIPDVETKILIYCNNNFEDDRINFASKMFKPPSDHTKSLTLALNIPTYINLYGYGYKSIFELDELLSILDTRISFEGSDMYKES